MLQDKYKLRTEMENFISQAIVTESNDFPAIQMRLMNPRTIRLLHAAMGLMTEGAELLDALKKHIFYGKVLDHVNIKEEAGDSLWYLAILNDEMEWTFEEVANLVIQKLKLRYPGKFSGYDALNRDLDAERNLLENRGSNNKQAAPLRFKGVVFSEGEEWNIDFSVTGESAYNLRHAMEEYKSTVGIQSDEQEQPSQPAGLRITEDPQAVYRREINQDDPAGPTNAYFDGIDTPR
jgi:NTP pyrophosphatase (non-canonical NTP hydrolase)